MNTVIKILIAQVTIALATAVVVWPLYGVVAAYSVMLGGIISVVPCAFLGARMMAVSDSQNPRKMLNSAYIGEAGKWLLTLALFVLVYQLVKPLSPAALLTGFIVTQAGIWLAILTDKRALTD